MIYFKTLVLMGILHKLKNIIKQGIKQYQN